MLFAVPAFFSACLLFVVEPMLAKWLLPALGGNPATWSACLVAYQALLLAGYGYAHESARRFSFRRQAALHMVLLAVAALATFAALQGGFRKPDLGAFPPAIGVPWLLFRRVGLPYVALASTTPLLTRWAAIASPGQSRAANLSLYAASNAGALVGLFAYPFLVEPFFDVSVELSAWAVAFLVFSFAMVGVAATVRRIPFEIRPHVELRKSPAPSTAERTRWLAYSFVPSVMLLAATNHLTVDVAATPLLWVLPLALYLVSFIVAFGGWRASWRGAALLAWIVGALGVSMNEYDAGAAPLYRQLGGTLLALFGACLLCHGELALRRPDAEDSTSYYLIVATGGALGGVFVSFVAPLIFTDYYELELGAMATFLVLLVAARERINSPWSRANRLELWLGCGLCLPLLFSSVLVRREDDGRDGHVVTRRRSFLGPLRVVDTREGRVLTHGRIQHGMQLRGVALRRTPTMYFGVGTGLERAMLGHHAARPRRIGVVGLGVGTIAAYGRPGDTLRFYELDSNVVDVAEHDFTFLSDSAARVDIVLGDGRLSLSREPPRAFDLLVLDAFSSDSVPVHLLTREAFSVYAANLAPDGVLLVNVSNRYLSVDRVVRASARVNGLVSMLVRTRTNRVRQVSNVEWRLAARNSEILARLSAAPVDEPRERRASDVLWTDSRASVLSIIR